MRVKEELMSWKDEPKIRQLEPYAREHGYRYVVLFGVKSCGTEYALTTYGTTKCNCDIAKIAGDQLHKLIESGVWPNWEKVANLAEGK